MYFLVDAKQQTVKAYKSQGEASREAIALLGDSVLPTSDPVQQLLKHPRYGDRFIMMNLSECFKAIHYAIVHENEAMEAAYLSESFERAIDDYYKR